MTHVAQGHICRLEKPVLLLILSLRLASQKKIAKFS